MRKTCSQCFKAYEQEFSVNETYHGDFCGSVCELTYLEQHGLVGGQSGAGVTG